MNKPLHDKYVDGDELTAKEFLKTIWFQEPKEYNESAVTEAMELYANHKIQYRGNRAKNEPLTNS